MRLGYAKLGRNIQFNEDKYGMQGDAEAPQLLERLARRNPDVEFMVIGKNSGFEKTTMPSNVTNPWPGFHRAPWNHLGGKLQCAFCKTPDPPRDLTCCAQARSVRELEEYIISLARDGWLDGIILHVGQHGTSNTPIPDVPSTWASGVLTSPQVWARNYAGYLVETLNALGDRTEGRGPVTHICVDPRNYLKARDVKWPSGCDKILAQYQFTRPGKHERYLDPRLPEHVGFRGKPGRGGELWLTQHHYRHADCELMILPDDWETWGARGFDERLPFGIASTAAWAPREELRRSWALKRWLNGLDVPIYGRWDDKSIAELGRPVLSNTPAEFPDLLGSWRTTVSLPPASRHLTGVNWTAAKPYQCFAARVACFMIPPMDAQGAMLPVRKPTAETRPVADDLWSVRQDWTENDLALARWLRVLDPQELTQRMQAAASSLETWTWLVESQRRLLTRRRNDNLLERTIEDMMGIGGSDGAA